MPDTLHKSRLLNVEEKPFKRITKRLLAPASPAIVPPQLPPTPPPDASAADEKAATQETVNQQQLNERRQWREDALLDFAAFESSIIRIQFLLTNNIQERERYAAEKVKIQATAQTVRDNTADLRVQLEDAQRTLALRKEYDDLAEKITSNRLLRPREDQHQNVTKLNAEIAELEQESQDYAQTWAERRQQFDKIIEEGRQLRRLIRDEKEEVERREGMEEREEGDDDHRGGSSGLGTPRPGSGGGSSPMHVSEKEGDLGTPGGLNVKGYHRRSRSPLRESQNAYGDKSDDPARNEDEEMAEDGGAAADPIEGLIAIDEREEGEADEEIKTSKLVKEDHMDVT